MASGAARFASVVRTLLGHGRALAPPRLQANQRFREVLKALGPTSVAIDCGANVGDVAEPIARTGARLFCYEPDKEIAQDLRDRLLSYPNATVVEAAVGIAPGTARLYKSPLYDQNPRLYSERNTLRGEALTRDGDGVWTKVDPHSAYTVEVVNLIEILEQLIARHGKIDLLKIDIEGAEVDILEAMERRKLFDPIDFTVVETHVRRFPEEQDRTENLIGRIESSFPLSKVNLHWR